MFKPRRMVSIVLVICILASCICTVAFAGRPEDVPSGSRNTILTVGQSGEPEEILYNNSEIFEKETILEELTPNEAETSFNNVLSAERTSSADDDKLSLIENLFGCNLEISTAYHILDNVTEKEYTRYISKDKTEISFSEGMGLFKISTIYNETTTTKSTKVSMEDLQRNCIALMPDLYCLLNIQEEYVLTLIKRSVYYNLVPLPTLRVAVFSCGKSQGFC